MESPRNTLTSTITALVIGNVQAKMDQKDQTIVKYFFYKVGTSF